MIFLAVWKNHFTTKMSYYQKLLTILSDTNPMGLTEIMEEMEVFSHKETYVIAAIKKGLDIGSVIKIDTPGEKRLYKGHTYLKS